MKSILTTLLFLTAFQAQADVVNFLAQVTTLESEDGRYAITSLANSEYWIVKTPASRDYMTPKIISDSRPMDGCLVVSLDKKITFEECAHDGPTFFQLKVGKETIPLTAQVQGRFFPAPKQKAK